MIGFQPLHLPVENVLLSLKLKCLFLQNAEFKSLNDQYRNVATKYDYKGSLLSFIKAKIYKFTSDIQGK